MFKRQATSSRKLIVQPMSREEEKARRRRVQVCSEAERERIESVAFQIRRDISRSLQDLDSPTCSPWQTDTNCCPSLPTSSASSFFSMGATEGVQVGVEMPPRAQERRSANAPEGIQTPKWRNAGKRPAKDKKACHAHACGGHSETHKGCEHDGGREEEEEEEEKEEEEDMIQLFVKLPLGNTVCLSGFHSQSSIAQLKKGGGYVACACS
eukprot:750192-Hanusia_phi.AAC.2